jgi:hypothetical protein
MPDYKMNRPMITGKETLWYRTLRAIYLANKPLKKKEWLALADIPFSDEPPKMMKSLYGGSIRSKWSYRHWRGLYPAMFRHFQRLKLVSYNCKTKKWSMNSSNYEIFCLSLNVRP